MAHTKKKTVVTQTASQFTRKATACFKVSGPNAGPSACKDRGTLSASQSSLAPLRSTQSATPVRNSSTPPRSSSLPVSSSTPLTQDNISRIVEAVLSNMLQTASYAVPATMDDDNATEAPIDELPPGTLATCITFNTYSHKPM